jgi:hypothetical protein
LYLKFQRKKYFEALQNCFTIKTKRFRSFANPSLIPLFLQEIQQEKEKKGHISEEEERSQ